MTWYECTNRLQKLVMELRAAQDGASRLRDQLEQGDQDDAGKQYMQRQLAVIDCSLTDAVHILYGFEDVRITIVSTVAGRMPEPSSPQGERTGEDVTTVDLASAGEESPSEENGSGHGTSRKRNRKS